MRVHECHLKSGIRPTPEFARKGLARQQGPVPHGHRPPTVALNHSAAHSVGPSKHANSTGLSQKGLCTGSV